MDRAAASAHAHHGVTFRDGIGERRTVVDANGQPTQELLSIRGELSAVPAFEFALRERVSRLAAFRHAYYAQVRSVERLNGPDSTLGLLSDRADGIRLSDLFTSAAARGFNLDINAAICLIRQLVPAVARLHESSRDVAHAALGPERIVITPQARLVITEYALGAALEQLRYSQERYWKDLRIALPRSAGLPRFDQRADVTQVGVVALSLILGRLLRDDEYPSRIGDVVASAWAVSPKGGFEPLPPGIRGWLGRALQLDARNSFADAIEASAEFDRVLGDSEYIGLPAGLEAFLARYQAAVAIELFTTDREPESTPAPKADPPVKPAAMPEAASLSADPLLAELMQSAPRISADDLQTLAASVAAPAPRLIPPTPSITTTPALDSAVPPALLAHLAKQKAEPVKSVMLPPSPPSNTASTTEADEPPQDMFGGHQRKSRRWSKAGLAAGAGLVVLLAIGIPLTRSMMTRTAPAPTMGTLAITTNPPGATAVIDGKPSGITPVTLTLIAGSHTVELRGEGEPRSIPVMISPGAQLSQYIELPKAMPIVGQLNVRSEPAGAVVSVDGVRRGTAPMIVTDLTPGDHVVVLDGEAGSVKQNVTIESGVQASLVVPMGAAAAPSQVSGWLGVSSPIELQVRQDDRVLGTSLSERIMLPVGRHDIELVNETLGFRVSRSVQIVAGRTAAVNVDLPNGTIALNAVPWADVWLDGERIGETPIGNYAAPIGVHDLVLRHPQFGEQHHKLTVSLKGVTRLSVDLRK